MTQATLELDLSQDWNAKELLRNQSLLATLFLLYYYFWLPNCGFHVKYRVTTPSVNYSHNSMSRFIREFKANTAKENTSALPYILKSPESHLYRSTCLSRQELKPSSETPIEVGVLPLSKLAPEEKGACSHKSRASAPGLFLNLVINWLPGCSCQKLKAHCIWQKFCWTC